MGFPGWRAHPDGVPGETRFPPIVPGHVVALGAVCDLRPPRADPVHEFKVGEFVALADGRRAMLHEDRGFSRSWALSTDPNVGPTDVRGTLDDLTRDVLNVVLPDDDDGEGHPWSWLAGLARERGLDVTADDLRALPYAVVFTDAVHRWLAGGDPLAEPPRIQ